MKTTLTVLLVVIILVACAPTVTAEPRANNFAFVFQDYSCGSVPLNTLDTISGTLVHTPLGDITSITISLRLTNDELEAIYREAIAIDFFHYPSKFVIPDDQVRGYHAPASRYQLRMTNGEITNSVDWVDDKISDPGYTKAERLQELISLIQQTIQSHPEIRQLPEPEAGCA